MTIDPERQLPPEEREPTANVLWFDALIRHQIFILRMAGSLRNETNRILNETEQDIARKIRDRLRGNRTLSTARIRKAETLIRQIRTLRGKAWDDVAKLWAETMVGLSKEEVQFLKAAVESSVPVEINTDLPAAEQLRAIIREKPFEGRTLREWANDVRRSDLRRIEDQIKIGLTQGESADEIARRVVGTARARGRDGTTQITRRNAEAITRTATNHVSNSARQEFLKANSDLFDEELYVATLDSRTTPICRSLDGERFDVGEGAMPPVHMGCRSLRVAIITEEAVGTRPAKASTEAMLVREYRAANNLGRGTSRSGLPRGHKGRFDQFSRRRVRELTGIVPAKTTYGEWLKTQSVEFQNDVLGVTKARLFRRGNLTLDKFVNRAGDEIPLAELARRDAKAFKDAGLDPKDFTRNAA